MLVVDHKLCLPSGSPVPFVKSPNVGGKIKAHTLGVVHYTAGSVKPGRAVSWLTNPRAKASAHLVIERSGAITQLVPLDTIAWHAGTSRYDHGGLLMEHLNFYSVGIELVNAGPLQRSAGKWRSNTTGEIFEPGEVIEAAHKSGGPVCGWNVYTPEQIHACIEALSAIDAAYGLDEIVGHEDIAVPAGRKRDPGPALDLDDIRAAVLGRRNGCDAGDEEIA